MISDDDEVNNKVLSKTSYKVNLNYFKKISYWVPIILLLSWIGFFITGNATSS